MRPTLVHLEHEGEVATLRLDRPPANAIDLDLAKQLEAVLARLEERDRPAALVVTGSGSCFSAGLDLKVVPRYGPEEQRRLIVTLNWLIARLYALPLPTVAAVNGHAVAGGLVLTLACDYRVCSDDPAMRLGLTETRVGIPFPVAAMAVVESELAPEVARKMVLVARNVAPETALHQGVVDELQPADRVLPRALEAARELAAAPRTAYARIKHQLRAGAIAAMREALAEKDPLLASWLSEETAAAAARVLKGEG